MDTARVWALLYSRAGDNGQALALAGSLGVPFAAKRLRYNRLRSVGRYLGPSFATLDRPSRAALAPPWPDAVIAIGRWSVPVARAIKRRSGGRTRIIFLGNPRVDPRHFDLIVATRDYLQPRAPNVLVAPLPLVSPRAEAGLIAPEPAWATDLPRPRSLLLIGGAVKYWTLSDDDIRVAVTRLSLAANRRGGSMLVGGSPRTPASLLAAAGEALAAADHSYLAPVQDGGLASLFASADEIFVTGDSMMMITEAILTGKPVGVLPLHPSAKGLRALGPSPAAEGSASRRRDLRRFWSALWEQRLAGTLAAPRAAPAGVSAASFAQASSAALGLVRAPVPRSIPTFQPAGAWLPGTRPMAQWLGVLRHNLGALSLAARDAQTPWYAKLLAGTSTMLAISPVDFTPDSIPGIGHLDDPILLVVGTLLAIGFVPGRLKADLRRRAARAERAAADHGAFAIALLWIAAGVRCARFLF